MSIVRYFHNLAHATMPVWVSPPSKQTTTDLPIVLEELAEQIKDTDEARIKQAIAAIYSRSQVVQIEYALQEMKQLYADEVAFTLTSEYKE
jgi:pantothenate synthetase